MPADNHVNVAAHNAVSNYFKTFVLLAIPDASKEDIFVFSPDENVKPVDYRKGDKVQCILISDFVFSAHSWAFKVKQYILKSEYLKDDRHKSRAYSPQAEDLRQLGEARKENKDIQVFSR